MPPKSGKIPRFGMHVAAWLLCLSSGVAQALQPPDARNSSDLDVMVMYIKSHPEVLATLQFIDLRAKTIFYGNGCSVRFSREYVVDPGGRIGGAAPLTLKEVRCSEVRPELDEADELGGITDRDTSSCDAVVEKEACETN
ncbi:MAG: hypothetical protein CSB47_10490 [Proteobacteria bacterium]|nr:MAG: hypothetical protein CSB47_10490 [Pseudomonadota bacterium]